MVGQHAQNATGLFAFVAMNLAQVLPTSGRAHVEMKDIKLGYSNATTGLFLQGSLPRPVIKAMNYMYTLQMWKKKIEGNISGTLLTQICSTFRRAF